MNCGIDRSILSDHLQYKRTTHDSEQYDTPSEKPQAEDWLTKVTLPKFQTLPEVTCVYSIDGKCSGTITPQHLKAFYRKHINTLVTEAYTPCWIPGISKTQAPYLIVNHQLNGCCQKWLKYVGSLNTQEHKNQCKYWQQKWYITQPGPLPSNATIALAINQGP